MTQVFMVWYTIDNTELSASRDEVREWAERLGLPDRPVRKRDPSAAFVKAFGETILNYVGRDGTPHRITGQASARKGEFLIWHVVREDGLKLAQVKFFIATQEREGIERNSHLLRTTMRRVLDDDDATAAREWLTSAEKNFRTEQGYVPWYLLRAILRQAMLVNATPVRRRRTLFFCYPDEVERIRSVGGFLLKSTTNSDFVVLPVHSSADYALFAQSADDYLAPMAQHLLEKIEGWQEQEWTKKRHLSSQYIYWREEYVDLVARVRRHESHLALTLPLTCSVLARVYRLMQSLHPTTDLPDVTQR